MRYIYEPKDRVRVVTAGPRQGQEGVVCEKWYKRIWLEFPDGREKDAFRYEDLEPSQPRKRSAKLKAVRSNLELFVRHPCDGRTKWQRRDVLRAVCGYLRRQQPSIVPLFQADFTQSLIDRRDFVTFLKGWGIRLQPTTWKGLYYTVYFSTEEIQHGNV